MLDILEEVVEYSESNITQNDHESSKREMEDSPESKFEANDFQAFKSKKSSTMDKSAQVEATFNKE